MGKLQSISDALLSKEKDNFANFGTGDNNIAMSVILESWKRSRKAGVDNATVKKEILAAKELAKRLKKSNRLMTIALPHIENMYSFIRGSGCAVSLCDKDGYILNIIGDPEIIQAAEKYSCLCVGANRSEAYFGTNAIGTSIFLNQPLQIRGVEHYKKMLSIYACSACPIHDEYQNIIGCMNLTGGQENVQSHTLGMVVAAVAGIEKELRLINANAKIDIMNNQLTTVLNSADLAIVTAEKGKIRSLNKVALQLFKLDYHSCVNKKINDVLQYNSALVNLEQHASNYNDCELEIQNKKYNITTYPYSNKFDQSVGSIIIFKEMKNIHKMINRDNGCTATCTLDDIIGQSPKMLFIKKLCLKAARSASTILILGESGTGKELVAQSIHNASDRKKGPFIAINCGALPKGLIESELFGYEGGAFTGANKEGKPGKFELADGGTLFLDEIGDMPLHTQVSILRVLQSKEIIRIGSNKAKKVDIRVIAATNKNLSESIKNNSFRADLYYRLNVLTITIPPLRERMEDLPGLINHLLQYYNSLLNKSITKIEEDTLFALSLYSWPGNVRELENIIERAVNIADSDTITLNDLPSDFDNLIIAKPDSITGSKSIDFKNKKSNFIKEEIKQALIKYNGNTVKASEHLGISRRTLYRKIDSYELNLKNFRKKKESMNR